MSRIITRFLFLILSLTFGQGTLAHEVETKQLPIKYIVEDTDAPDNMSDGDPESDIPDPAQVVINT